MSSEIFQPRTDMFRGQKLVQFSFMFILCLIVSACKGSEPELPSPQAKSTADISEVFAPSSTMYSSVKPTGTPKLFPQFYMTQTVSQPVNTFTVEPRIALTEQAIALKETQITSFSPSCSEPNDLYFNWLSPKGNWLAVSCGYERGDQILTIYGMEGQRWVLQFKDYVSEEFIVDGQPPRGNLYPIHWGNDEKYLYFRSVIGFSGGGTCFYGHAGQGLYRIDLETGTVSATLPPLIGPAGYILSFSPTGQWLAFNGGIPTLLNLQTGEKVFLQEGENQVGDFSWSPDGTQVAYGACQMSEDLLTEVKSTVRIFSLNTRQTKTLLEVEYGFLRIKVMENYLMKIFDEYNEPQSEVYFDWTNGRFITPTPNP